MKRFFSDSFEITPETEGARYHETEEEMRVKEMGAMRNLLSDTPNDFCLFTGNLNDRTRNSTANLAQAFQNQSIKQKNTSNVFVVTNIDIETYEKRVKNDMGQGINFYRAELAYLIEHIIHNKVEFAEKAKLFLAIRILYKVIIDYIYKIFDISVSKESLPYVIYDYKCCNSASYHQTGHFRKEQIPQIMEYYNLIPEGLTTIFLALNPELPNNNFIKQNVCKILGDIKYFPGMEFFEKTLGTNKENILVVMEIKRILASFRSSLQVHQPDKTHKELLKKQYAKTLSPKINFKSAKVEFSKVDKRKK